MEGKFKVSKKETNLTQCLTDAGKLPFHSLFIRVEAKHSIMIGISMIKVPVKMPEAKAESANSNLTNAMLIYAN